MLIRQLINGWLMLLIPLFILPPHVTAATFDPAASDETAWRPPKATHLFIGGGFSTGIYYAVATLLCHQLNAARQESGIRCGVGMTGGSLDNRERLQRGLLQFGLMQSDIAEESAADGALQGVVKLHDEMIYMALAERWRDTPLADLPWDQIQIGVVGSGSFVTANRLLTLSGIESTRTEDGTYRALQKMSTRELEQKMGPDQLDGFFLTTGKNSTLIKEILQQHPDYHLRSLPAITGQKAYRPATIAANSYPNQPQPIDSYTVYAMLVTRADVPSWVIETLLERLFSDLKPLQQVHKALTDLAPESMAIPLPLPLHPAAAQYYRQQGWLIP